MRERTFLLDAEDSELLPARQKDFLFAHNARFLLRSMSEIAIMAAPRTPLPKLSLEHHSCVAWNLFTRDGPQSLRFWVTKE